MVDWGMIISAVLGLVGGGALTGFMLRKQTEGSATAGVVKESMDALKSALETLTSQQEVFAITIKSKDDEIVSLKDQVKELNLRVAENVIFDITIDNRLAGIWIGNITQR